MNLAGKRVLVTGGTRGIRRATVEAFLQAGARVAVNGSSAASVSSALAGLGAGDQRWQRRETSVKYRAVSKSSKGRWLRWAAWIFSSTTPASVAPNHLKKPRRLIGTRR